MKKLVLFFTIVLIVVSCNNSSNLMGNWKTSNNRWKAKIVKENGDLILIGGGIEGRNSKFKIQKKGGEFVISIPPISFPLKYENNKLYFNNKVWIKE